jgi:hypothetical protein
VRNWTYHQLLSLMQSANPQPVVVPATPSVTIPVIVAWGHGLVITLLLLHVLEPSCDCINPGLGNAPPVVFTRTQPPDSCNITARMKRWSTPVSAATCSIASLINIETLTGTRDSSITYHSKWSRFLARNRQVVPRRYKTQSYRLCCC